MKSHYAGDLSDLQQELFNAERIRTRVQELATQIQTDYPGQILNFVALMDGASVFLADLIRHIQQPIQVYSIVAKSYYGGEQSSGKVHISQASNFQFRGNTVFLIDDILDTGLTLQSLQAHLQKQHPQLQFRSVVLLQRHFTTHTPCITADYVGFEIQDQFVVGYGLDYDGFYRNLPCIGVLQPLSV